MILYVWKDSEQTMMDSQDIGPDTEEEILDASSKV